MSKSERKEKLQATQYRLLQWTAGELGIRSHGKTKYELIEEILKAEKQAKKTKKTTASKASKAKKDEKSE